MDHKFTTQIGDWLNADPGERDYALGAIFLLKLSGNQIMYKNIMINPEAKKDFITFHLQKYYNFRILQLTHQQVDEMQSEVNKIAARRNLNDKSPSDDKEAEEKRLGKRDDHDSLPDEVKSKFVENLSILQRMRELHLKLRSLSLDNVTCPDSERYPFLKELINLDKKMHANWNDYDAFVADVSKNDTSKSQKKSQKLAGKSKSINAKSTEK